MIVPPLGLGLESPVLSLLLALFCLFGLMLAARATARGGRRRALSPVMFSLLALAFILAARELWLVSW